jgi:hypothetical protein
VTFPGDVCFYSLNDQYTRLSRHFRKIRIVNTNGACGAASSRSIRSLVAANNFLAAQNAAD